jgi:synaptojanin
METPCKYTLLTDMFSVKAKHKAVTKQKGVVRTNCLDCLDRTNVVQTKICVRMFEDLLRGEHCVADISKLMIQMWTFSGDFISKIYAGTNAVLQTLLQQSKQSIFDRINQGVTGVKRFIK